MAFHPLRNAIQQYDWGSHTALAALQGRATPTQRPEAELWIGTHPRAPSQVAVGAAWRSLRDCIAAEPAHWLGPDHGAPELPFLLKVLAAERALSLQTHPDAAAARRGHAREEAAGIPLDATTRCYPDPNPKPELLCALTPFEALCGLREGRRAADHARGLGLPRLAEWLGAAGLPGARFSDLLGEPARGEPLLAEALAAAPGSASEDLAWVARLAALHPGDPGALAPLFMHRVVLEPGQALFLRPGRLHSYLRGVGVELMAASDNVLRAGLTTKHVDPAELRAVLELEAADPELLAPVERQAGEWVYPAATEAFQLAVLRPPRGAAVSPSPSGGAEILLCTEGAARVDAAGSDEHAALPCGEALLVRAGSAYRVSGAATVYRASPGAP